MDFRDPNSEPGSDRDRDNSLDQGTSPDEDFHGGVSRFPDSPSAGRTDEDFGRLSLLRRGGEVLAERSVVERRLRVVVGESTPSDVVPIHRLSDVKSNQIRLVVLGALPDSPPYVLPDSVITYVEELLFSGLEQGVKSGVYGAAFLRDYNQWARGILEAIRSDPKAFLEQLEPLEPVRESYELHHQVDHLFNLAQRKVLQTLVARLREPGARTSEFPNTIPDFLRVYFDDMFLPPCAFLSEEGLSYARELQLRWIQWCVRVILVIHEWIGEQPRLLASSIDRYDDFKDFESLARRLVLTLASD